MCWQCLWQCHAGHADCERRCLQRRGIHRHRHGAAHSGGNAGCRYRHAHSALPRLAYRFAAAGRDGLELYVPFCHDDACREASNQEIIRRYYAALNGLAEGTAQEEEAFKIELLMKQAHITVEDRKVVDAALKRAEETNGPAAAMELPNGQIITGKTSCLLGASSALLLNALKNLAGLNDELHLISPSVIEPIQKLKTEYLGSINPRLHTDEILIALSICAATDDNAKLALEQIPKLSGCQAHTSVMLSSVDIKQFKRLNVQLTSEAKYENKRIYH